MDYSPSSTVSIYFQVFPVEDESSLFLQKQGKYHIAEDPCKGICSLTCLQPITQEMELGRLLEVQVGCVLRSGTMTSQSTIRRQKKTAYPYLRQAVLPCLLVSLFWLDVQLANFSFPSNEKKQESHVVNNNVADNITHQVRRYLLWDIFSCETLMSISNSLRGIHSSNQH